MEEKTARKNVLVEKDSERTRNKSGKEVSKMITLEKVKKKRD